MTVTAIGKLNDDTIEAEVLNPGDWFGKMWLIEVGCGISCFFFAAEADSLQDALDVLADSERGHLIEIEESSYDDYGHLQSAGDEVDGEILEADCWVDLNGKRSDKRLMEPARLGNSGKPCDLDHVRGYENFVCTYHDPGDKHCNGISPKLYPDRTERYAVIDGTGKEAQGDFRTEDEAYKWLDKNIQLPARALLYSIERSDT